MTALVVKPEHLAQIRTHAQQIYPEECCGLLLGHNQPKRVIEVVPVANSWGEEAAEMFGDIGGSKRNRFSIDPKDMLQVQKAARDRHLDIIGIYHSHPDHEAVPSELDRAIAWAQYSYMIVSVEQGATNFTSWTLDENHQFQPEEILTITSKVSKS